MSSIVLDLDASPIAGQTGWAILDLQGSILKQSSSSFQPNDVAILFQMFTLLPHDTTSTTNTDDDEAWERMTVTCSGSSRFIVTRDEAHVYMVQTQGV
jgi:hypothetical protein